MKSQNFKIKLVNQIDDKTCVAACMAMIAGVSIERVLKITEDIGEPPFSEETSMIGLTQLKVLPRRQLENQILHGRIYIADVPSLNFLGTMHAVVLDFRDIFEVYDPQNGREGKKFYTSENISGWANLIYCVRV